MKITDVKVRKIFGEEEGTMRAVASVTFDGQFALHDVKIINSKVSPHGLKIQLSN